MSNKDLYLLIKELSQGKIIVSEWIPYNPSQSDPSQSLYLWARLSHTGEAVSGIYQLEDHSYILHIKGNYYCHDTDLKDLKKYADRILKNTYRMILVKDTNE
jgi:hypothetical protein